jgi:hypothetical protein
MFISLQTSLGRTANGIDKIPDTVRVETLYMSHFLAKNPSAAPPSSLVKGVRRDLNIQPPLPLLHLRCTRGSPLGQGYGHTGGSMAPPLDFPKGDRSEALPFGSEGAVLLHPLPKGVAVAQPLDKGRAPFYFPVHLRCTGK